MIVRKLVTTLGLVAATVAMLPSEARADSWCWTSSSTNGRVYTRKLAYDAWVKAKGAGLGATPKGTMLTPIVIDGKSPQVSAHYLGSFSDTKLAEAPYWAGETGTLTFALLKEKDPTSYTISNRLGLADRMGATVHICVYKTPRSRTDNNPWDWIEESNRSASDEPNLNSPSASLSIPGPAMVATVRTAMVKKMSHKEFAVAFVLRESMNYSGRLKLNIKATRVPAPPEVSKPKEDEE